MFYVGGLCIFVCDTDLIVIPSLYWSVTVYAAGLLNVDDVDRVVSGAPTPCCVYLPNLWFVCVLGVWNQFIVVFVFCPAQRVWSNGKKSRSRWNNIMMQTALKERSQVK